MDELEQRLRTALADDALEVLPRPDALSTIRAGVRRRHRRTRVATAASAMAAAAIAVAAAVTVPALLNHRTPNGNPPATPLSGSWRVAATVPLPPAVHDVAALAASTNAVWLGAADQLVRIDTVSGQLTTYTEPATPASIAATPHRFWVAERSGSSCTLDERDTRTGSRALVHRVPCSASAQLSVTANGNHAWLVVRDSRTIRLDLFDAGVNAPVRSDQFLGTPYGERPLAIGGAFVFVLSRSNSAPIVTRYEAERLIQPIPAPVPDGVAALAYGGHRLILAGKGGEWSLDPLTLQVRHLADDATRDVTTGNSLVWSVVGHEPTTLVVRDPASGRRIGAVVVAGTVSHVLAINTDLWTVVTGTDDRTSVLRLTPVGG